MAGVARSVFYGLMAFLAVGVALVSYRYLVPGAPGSTPRKNGVFSRPSTAYDKARSTPGPRQQDESGGTQWAR